MVGEPRLLRRAERDRATLIDLIAAGDGDKAEAHWRAHLTGSGQLLVSGAGNPVVGLFS